MQLDQTTSANYAGKKAPAFFGANLNRLILLKPYFAFSTVYQLSSACHSCSLTITVTAIIVLPQIVIFIKT